MNTSSSGASVSPTGSAIQAGSAGLRIASESLRSVQVVPVALALRLTLALALALAA